MAKRRFKVKELSETRKFEGTITIEDLRKAFKIPDCASVTVRVPGGGDWSNTDLDIDRDTSITVTWEEVKGAL